MAAELPTLQEMLVEQFERRARRLAATLRDVADQIDRRAADINRVPSVGAKSAGAVAADIVHTLMWGLANGSADGVVDAAAEWDRHFKDGEPDGR